MNLSLDSFVFYPGIGHTVIQSHLDKSSYPQHTNSYTTYAINLCDLKTC